MPVLQLMNGIRFPTVKTAINSDAFTLANAPSMHQTATTPQAAPSTGKKRHWTRKRKIIYGAIALAVLLIIALIINSKREKPIPVTTERAVRKTILQTVSK
jgi:cell division protein FtsL